MVVASKEVPVPVLAGIEEEVMATTLELNQVLILGEDTRSFLAVIRSLGRAGLEVHAGSWVPEDPALRSRYIRHVHVLPRPGSPEWRESLLTLLKSHRFSLVIPTNDPAILALREGKDDFELYAPLYLLNDRAAEVCGSKILTRRLAEKLSIPVARGAEIRSIEELPHWLSLPLVLKPAASFGAAGASRQEVRKVFDRSVLNSILAPMLQQGPVIVEENFIGAGVGIEVLCARGEVLTAFQHERVHEPLHGGGSSYRKSVPVHPQMLDAVRRICQAVDYHGLGMFEFKFNAHTGRWILIEINGRFWGSLPLAVACGANFPLFLYQMLTEGRVEFPGSFKTGAFCRHPTYDLEWMIGNLRADRSDPTLATRPLFSVVRELFNPLFLRECSDTLTRDDPMPGVQDLKRYLAGKLRSLRSKLERWYLNHRGSRGAQAKQMRSELDAARCVLFLCYGNICRSPFAAQLASRLLPGKKILSAGFYPVTDRRAPEIAIHTASEFGVVLSAHRSKALTPQLVATADLIFVFDQNNLSAFKASFPEAAGKARYLGALAAEGPLLIEDPYGRSAADFRECYRLIVRALTPKSE